MIRRFEDTEIGRIADIWLEANLEAHSFISPEYWKDNLDMVRALLPQSEVYIYEDNGKAEGFVGLSGEYIEGIFVAGSMQSRGIGKSLLDYVKKNKAGLCLHVYQKNIRAIRFYLREGFVIRREGLDESTGEKDYEMVWKRAH